MLALGSDRLDAPPMTQRSPPRLPRRRAADEDVGTPPMAQRSPQQPPRRWAGRGDGGTPPMTQRSPHRLPRGRALRSSSTQFALDDNTVYFQHDSNMAWVRLFVSR